MDFIYQVGVNSISISITIGKYVIYTFCVTFFLHWLTYRYLRILFLIPFLVVLLPILTLLIPTFSVAYSLFLFGFLFIRHFGIQPTDRNIDLSPFQRKHGQTVNIIGNIFMIIGFLWGCYNILFD